MMKSLWDFLTGGGLRRQDFAHGYHTVELPDDAPNAIQHMTSKIGLPWTRSRRDLLAQFGLGQAPVGDRAVCLLPDGMLRLDGLLAASCHEFDWDTPLAPGSWQALIGIGRDPLLNMEYARDQIARHLGPAPISTVFDRLNCGWQAGRCTVELSTYPPEWRSDRPAPIYRDPRIRSACHIAITPRHRIALSPQELAWVRTASQAIKACPVPQASRDRLWFDHCDYTRAMPSGAPKAWLSLSADGRAVMIRDNDLVVMPRDRALHLRLQRIMPAKGGGGSHLMLVHLRDRLSRGIAELGLIGVWGTEIDLEPAARQIARALDLGLVISPPQYDC